MGRKGRGGTIAPKVVIVIVNWNGYADTIECLESVYQISYSNYDVVVVDNASKDKSTTYIANYAEGNVTPQSGFFKYDDRNKPLGFLEYTKELAENGGDAAGEARLSRLPSNRRLRLIQNDRNYGFAEANNSAIRYALTTLNPEYILLLNNDTVVDRRFLDALVVAAERDAAVGIVGPKILYYDFEGEKNVIRFTGGSFLAFIGQPLDINASEVDIGQYDEMLEVDFVSGACLLAKIQVIESVGLLSTDYFLYWEENDLCIRAAGAGFKSVYVPTAKIWHKISSSIKKTSGKGTYYRIRGRFFFMKKHGSSFQILGFLTYFFFLQFWWTLARYLRCRRFAEGQLYARGVLAGLFTRPA